MKPNILWICTDQQRFDSLGCYGNELVDTPNIDQLAKEGMLFRNTYCQSPVCSPSRASFLTGRYPRTCGVRQNGQRMPAREHLISRIFSDHGYTCGLAGKLHIAPCHPSVSPVGEPRGNDGYHVFHWSHHPDFYGQKESNWPLNAYNIWLEEKGKCYQRVPYENSPYVYQGMDAEFHQSRWCADKTIGFIKAHKAYDNPWFFSLNFYDPHHDFDPPKDLLEKYKKKMTFRQLPNCKDGEWNQKPYVQKRDHRGAYDTPGFFDYEAMTQQDHLLIKAAYLAMVELVDWEVGRVIEALKQSGQYENTIIIFTSDHGELLGDHGIYLKGPYFYDPLVKVPLMISWPGNIIHGVRRNAMVELVDVSPTLLELSGIASGSDYGMQGKSIAKLLLDPECADVHRESVYSEYYNAMGLNHSSHEKKSYMTMAANQRYKLIYCHNTNEGELYDTEKDPGEQENLYGRQEFQDVQIKMLETMTNLMAGTIDSFPVREAFY